MQQDDSSSFSQPDSNGQSLAASASASRAFSSSPTPSGKNPDAERLKEEGNKLFAEKHFEKAIELYSQAIELDPTNPVYYSNRAFCHIRLEKYGGGIEDATKAIELDPKFIKAYYRRGTALFALSKLRDARKDFLHVTKMLPRDADAKQKLHEIDKELRKQAFLKAIENEKSKPMSETIDLTNMTIDDNYTGPRLLSEGHGVTPDFVIELIDYFKQQKRLPRRYVYQLVLHTIYELKSLPTLLHIPIPIHTELTVCGDIHGQYYDLGNIFHMNGLPSPSNPYLFNGDFVDRGSFSLEVILLFCAYKCLYPHSFHLLRGNHESLNMNSIYGFQGEVSQKVDSSCFELFTEMFNYLPLAALLGDRVLVVHGGLFSDDDVTLDKIEKIDRVQQPPESGLMCELLWADPQPQRGRAPSKRGVGLSFGPDVSERFCVKNKLDMVVRSHEVKEEGYEVTHNGRIVTVFSAPNYCDSMGNKGAYIRFDSDLKPTYTKFVHVPHPPIQPMAYASNHMFRQFGGFA